MYQEYVVWEPITGGNNQLLQDNNQLLRSNNQLSYDNQLLRSNNHLSLDNNQLLRSNNQLLCVELFHTVVMYSLYCFLLTVSCWMYLDTSQMSVWFLTLWTPTLRWVWQYAWGDYGNVAYIILKVYITQSKDLCNDIWLPNLVLVWYCIFHYLTFELQKQPIFIMFIVHSFAGVCFARWRDVEWYFLRREARHLRD